MREQTARASEDTPQPVEIRSIKVPVWRDFFSKPPRLLPNVSYRIDGHRSPSPTSHGKSPSSRWVSSGSDFPLPPLTPAHPSARNKVTTVSQVRHQTKMDSACITISNLLSIKRFHKPSGPAPTETNQPPTGNEQNIHPDNQTNIIFAGHAAGEIHTENRCLSQHTNKQSQQPASSGSTVSTPKSWEREALLESQSNRELISDIFYLPCVMTRKRCLPGY